MRYRDARAILNRGFEGYRTTGNKGDPLFAFPSFAKHAYPNSLGFLLFFQHILFTAVQMPLSSRSVNYVTNESTSLDFCLPF